MIRNAGQYRGRKCAANQSAKRIIVSRYAIIENTSQRAFQEEDKGFSRGSIYP